MRGLPFRDDDVETLQPRLERMARDLVLECDSADDLVQEAWLAALRAGSDPVRHPLQWMKVVMQRHSTRQRRRELMRNEREELAARGVALDDDAAERASTAAWIAAEVATLGEPYRDVLEQRFFEECSIGDIADRLGRSPATVRSQMLRGLAKLREKLDRRAGSRDAWAGMLLGAAGLEPPAPPAVVPMTSRASLAPMGAVLLFVAALSVGVVAWLVWPAGDDVAAAASSEVTAAPEAEAVLENAVSAREPAPVPEPEPAAPAAAPPPPAPIEPSIPTDVARLRVVVRDAVGAPLAGVYGDFLGRDRKSLLDGQMPSDGVATFDVPEADLVNEHWLRGGVVVSMRTRELAWSNTYSVLLEPGDERVLEVALDEPSCGVQGVVVDSAGEPVVGARVDATSLPMQRRQIEPGIVATPKTVEVASDANGRFVIHGLPRKPHMLRVVSRTSPVWTEPFTPTSREEAKDLRVELEEPGVVGGFVTYADGTPAARARVWSGGNEAAQHLLPATEADEDGFYLLRGLDSATCRIFACDRADPSLFATTTIEARRGEEQSFDAVLTRTPGVRVRVVDSDGSPVSGAKVVVAAEEPRSDWSAGLTADAEGRGVFFHVPDAPLELRVYPKSFSGTGDPDAYRDGVRPGLEELVLTVGSDTAPAGELAGRVLDDSGRAITVYAVFEDFAEKDALPDGRSRFGEAGLKQSSVDADGAFLFQGLQAGRYRVYAAGDLPSGGGVVDAGTHVVLPEQRCEVGTLRFPSAGAPIRLIRGDGEWPESRVTLHFAANLGPYKRRFMVRELGESLDVRVFPGSYVVRVENEVLATDLNVSDGSGFTLRLPRYEK